MALKLEKLPRYERDRLRNYHFIPDITTGKSPSDLMKLSPKGCHEWQICKSGRNAGLGCSRSSSSRYGTVSVKDFTHREKIKKNFTVNAHVLAFFLFNDKVPASSREVVSHLCSNKKCVKPDHLVLEPQVINLERSKCVKAKDRRCLGHDVYKSCIFPN